MPDFYDVSVAIADAKAIAWDTCHKIYVLMDDAQVEKMREYGYGDEQDPDSLITKEQMTSQQMLDTVKKWYDESCFLRFVEAVETTPEGIDPNEGFTTLIEQGADEVKNPCPYCGEEWEDCTGDCQDDLDEEEEDDDY
jgi:hypothetical protein